MRRSLYVSVRETTVGSLHYLTIEYSGIVPIEFLRHMLHQRQFGILMVGFDGPCQPTPEQVQKAIEHMRRSGISAGAEAGFLWIGPGEVASLCEMELFTCYGYAVLLRATPIGETFEFPYLPVLSGFNKNKLSTRDAALLNSVLSPHDIYVYDDFGETLIVTKNPDILHDLIDQVECLQQEYQTEGEGSQSR